MRRAIGRIAMAAMAMAGMLACAEAADIAAGSFGEPFLDGVSAGLRTDGVEAELSPYVFAGGRDWPALRYRAPSPLDWHGAGAFALPVDNPAAAPFELLLRLDDRPDATGDERSLTGVVTVPPHTRATVLLPLAGTPLGMRGRPPSGLAVGAGDLLMRDVLGAVDRSHIVALHVSGTRSAADQTLRIGAPMLREGSADDSFPLADAYGQAVGGQWPEKVGSDAMLRRKLDEAAAATRRLAAAASHELTAADGGLAGQPLRATGFFRTQKGARWMLVTPEGRPFFSLGVDVVSPHNTTIVEGRWAMFAGLPDADGPLGLYFGQDAGRATFDVGAANLDRGLGPDWARLWPAQVVTRLRAWGFNTLGNWSDPGLYPAMPHVAFQDFEGDSATVSMGWRSLPDPFDPRFAVLADDMAASVAARHHGDRTLIGTFSGNELPWGNAEAPADGLTAHVLVENPASPARRALIEDLRRRYGTPAGLAAAWGVPTPADWDAPIAWPARPTAAALKDRDAFESRFAERYFATVAAALHRHDPEHLYLGTRFASATPAAVQACAKYCDVLSFNIYGQTPERVAPLWRGLDRPVLIGEFHFGSLDRGSFWGGMTGVPTEADRGGAYAGYLASAMADPAIVGCHWYQYADEPLTGRPYDGENGHLGLVAVTDVPFASFVAAVAAENRQAMGTFAAKVGAAAR